MVATKTSLPLAGLLLAALAIAPAGDARGSALLDAGARRLETSRLALGEQTLDLVRVRAGTFTMGSAPADPAHEADESPAHPVTITRDFFIARTPTTRAQFAAFVAETGFRTEVERGTSGGSGWDGARLVQSKGYTWKNPGFPQGDDQPVVLVTYTDALAFTSWASAKSGKAVRLPTEAEYELAERAGTTTRYYGGDDDASGLAIGWFKENAGRGTHPVATRAPSGLGLQDMAGDVWEWCADVYAPYAAGPALDPRNETPAPGEPLRRVLRGGSWLDDVAHGRSAARRGSTPGSGSADVGFRVVVSLVGKPAAGALGAVPPLAPPGRRVDESGPAPGAPPEAASGHTFGWLTAGLVVGAGLVAVYLLRRRQGH